MSMVTEDLARLLKGVKRAGAFSVTGTVDIFPPGIEVEGVGPIALPLLPAQARALIAVASRAPYGRGDRTLIDTDVRRTWQIDAGQVHIRGRAWSDTLAAIVARAAEGLGVEDKVEAELYKLLVYDEGAFFVSHRDSEKAAGMFATLVISLPSIYTGGALIIRHGAQEARFDPPRGEPSEAAFAAFYADCPHEVEPVTGGCRLTLIYNLIRRGAGPAPRAPSHDAEARRVAARLRLWADAGAGSADREPAKLIYPLEHAYTEPGFGFAALKGADAARAGALMAAAQAADCDLRLALVSIEESGAAEYTGDYRRYRRRRWNDDDDDEDDDQDENDFEIIEVHERVETLEDWRRPDGGDPGLGPLAFDLAEVSPPGALDHLKPDEVSFREATGNEGGSFERRYRAAALVLWPRRDRLAIIGQGGLAASLPHLDWLADQWTRQGAPAGSPVLAEAHELAGHMLASWPRGGRGNEAGTDAARMLNALMRLKDGRRINDFLRHVSASGLYRAGDNEAITGALALLDGPTGVSRLAGVIAGNHERFAAIADLVKRVAEAADDGALDWPMATLAPVARALLKAMPAGPGRARAVDNDDLDSGNLDGLDLDDLDPDDDLDLDDGALGIGITGAKVALPGVSPTTLVDVLTGLEAIDPALAHAALDTVLAWPAIYGADVALVPAALALADSASDQASARRLVDAAARHLRARIALPLDPPTDWRRDSRLVCDCARCVILAGFLDDPAQKTWTFRAAQADRVHMEATIRRSRPDIDTTTIRKGSPHSLICTKNQASHERRVAQRKKDLEDLARLASAGAAV
jgi:predicted 2-oxoglutarate/Fe(II)-dependent dioxygenase YbiX